MGQHDLQRYYEMGQQWFTQDESAATKDEFHDLEMDNTGIHEDAGRYDRVRWTLLVRGIDMGFVELTQSTGEWSTDYHGMANDHAPTLPELARKIGDRFNLDLDLDDDEEE